MNVHIRKSSLDSVPILVGMMLLIGVTACAQSQLSRAPHARVVTISPQGIRGTEPSIAVNPANPNQVIAAFQPATIASSSDGAQTFNVVDLPAVPGWRGGGDVSVTFDNAGRAYLCTLHFDKLGSVSYWAHGAGRNGIFVRRSPDGGKTWETDATPVKAWTGTEPDIQWEDMPRIFADNLPHSPYAGNVYVGWIEWQLDQSIILFSSSTDHGKTFSQPMRISTHAGLPRDDNGSLVGFVGGVGADGTIYAIWNDGETIAFTQSHDGGKTFTPSRSIIDVAPPYFGGAGGIPGVPRVMGFPQIGVDARQNGGDALYLSWSDYRNGDVDVFISKSTDHGKTWSAPIRVNSDPVHNGIDQFFQWMTVDPVSGNVYVQFYDRRDDSANRKTGFSIARSTDGGKVFANYSWADSVFETQQAFLGDYTWLTAYGDRVYGAWSEAISPPADVSPAPPGRGPRAFTVVKVGFADFSGLK